MYLSPNFRREEFEKDGPMPDEVLPSYSRLAVSVLEPVRKQFEESIDITSGFRTPAANAAARGVPNSEHMATSQWAAADFEIVKYRADMRPVFDWMRMSNLPFHQVTLEHGENGDVIHVSVNETAMARQAMEGATHNTEPYKAWPVGVSV